ncbi:hypothetical protein PYCC9005_003291 [Savitreella phatthalungensis]
MLDETGARDIKELREIGIKHGYPARLRRQIWSILLGVDDGGDDRSPSDGAELHPDEKQVTLDTNRSFTNLAELTDLAVTSESLPDMKRSLELVIVGTLRTLQWSHYYQGLHDIAQVLLLVAGEKLAMRMLRRLAMTHLRDFMLAKLSPTTSLLLLVLDQIRVIDPGYYAHMRQLGVEPFYALASLLTWWSHSVDEHESICRIFDFLLAGPPTAILYTIAAATLLKKDEVTLADDADLAFLALSKPPKDIGEMLVLASELQKSIRPIQLAHWRRISDHSCFKTWGEHGTLDERAHEHARQQELEVKNDDLAEERRKRIRKALTLTSAQSMILGAIGFGCLAYGVAVLLRPASKS